MINFEKLKLILICSVFNEIKQEYHLIPVHNPIGY